MSDHTGTTLPEQPAELLARLPGWRAVRNRAPRPVLLDGTEYTVTSVARSGRRVALCCEPPVGAPLPGYAARIRLRRSLEEIYARPLTIFTDAARNAEVWCWTTLDELAGPTHHERIRWPRPGDGSLAAERLAGGFGERRGELREEPGSPGAAVIRAHLELAGRPAGAGASPAAVLREALSDPRGAGTVRALWRAALGLRVLDPSCGTGGWLMETMETLERIFSACLAQMEVWVGEAALRRGKRRPEYLRDFRDALARAGDAPEGRSAFIRETVLLHNLFGAERNARVAAFARRRLSARLGSGSDGAALLTGRIRFGAPAAGFSTRAAVARALMGTEAAAGELCEISEQVESIARADALLRRERLAGAIDARAVAAGCRVLETRRAAVRQVLDDLAFRADGGPAGNTRARRAWLSERRPLHGWLEWGGAATTPGFHLVRGDPE